MSNSSENARAIVLHASERAADVQRAIDNARLLRRSFPDARVRIIVNGEALEALPSASTQSLAEGVEIAACTIGLERRGIDESTLPAGIQSVPAAPVAIVEEQFAGAAYIRL